MVNARCALIAVVAASERLRPDVTPSDRRLTADPRSDTGEWEEREETRDTRARPEWVDDASSLDTRPPPPPPSAGPISSPVAHVMDVRICADVPSDVAPSASEPPPPPPAEREVRRSGLTAAADEPPPASPASETGSNTALLAADAATLALIASISDLWMATVRNKQHASGHAQNKHRTCEGVTRARHGTHCLSRVSRLQRFASPRLSRRAAGGRARPFAR